MGRPKTPERRKPGNAELRSAMGAIELWIRHAAVKNSGVIKVTHHELVTIHDALVLALREDNPQSLLVLDTDAGTEVSKDIVEEATEKGSEGTKTPVVKVKHGTLEDDAALDKVELNESREEEVPKADLEPDQTAESEAEIDPELDLDLDVEGDVSPKDTGSKDKP